MKQLLRVALVLAFAIIPASSIFGQKGFAAPDFAQPITMLDLDDRMVMNALRSIHDAEWTYQNAIGNGNYATLAQLQEHDLIDPVLASGKFGYTFSATVHYTSMFMMGGFDVTATPVLPQARAISFYMNETGDIRGARKRGHVATAADPLIEANGTTQRTENERLAVASLRDVFSAEVTYQATYGAGEFGTFSQLYEAGLSTGGFALSTIYRGYTATLTVIHTSATMPARFTLTVVPQQYSRSGVRSFYIDETGVLRGADKNGVPAGPSDPPVQY